MDPIVTRFPPSPTGYLHVGGARTALFNWLYARHTGGRFVLRIEDTDTVRSTQASVDAIFEALRWLQIDWDDGPYFQSRRTDVYLDYARRLYETGHAYYCTCSPEAVEAMRQRAVASGANPRYDGTCRERGLGTEPGAVLRFRTPASGTTVLDDVVKGSIVFQNSELDDFVIVRSDGMPTYNFVVVVDDIAMGINTVIRGDDHVMNTPKQMQIYRALGARLPVFAHVPMVLGPDRTRLSKRHGAMSVTAYRDMGYLPDAFLNYLARLGWSCGDQEFFTRQELIEKFTLDNIGRSAGIFDLAKLQALNADHIQASTPEALVPHISPILVRNGLPPGDVPSLPRVIRTLQPRCKTLEEMVEQARFYFADEVAYDPEAVKKIFKPTAFDPLQRIVEALERIPVFSEAALEAAFSAVMAATGLKLGKIAQPVRLALTGRTASPGIFETIEALGRDKTLARLRRAAAWIQAHAVPDS
jgi:glutamyl-tRNA synthetase